ncbi:hypothetical protein ACJIZ3_021956 [Penstemon smallii]|uniref:PWWP domain-containing protein n=1 Tax=Penstemon smallii TaxID=265156 RepID=A0ABD3SN50_9LAMI
MENSSDKGILADGARVLEEPKALVGESNTEISRSELRVGPLRINDMMNLVGRVLNGKSGMDKAPVEDVSTSKNGSEMNLVVDLNAWKGLNTDSTRANVMAIKGAENDKDRPIEETGFNGMQDLATGEVVPDGKSKSEEVIDARADVLIPKECGEQFISEKEGKYHVSDLVWGKVRSHPWWPGQIFAPSDASDRAIKHQKKDSHLIAYFGDQTFAWNEESKIKPFQMHFSQMEKQSNAEGFAHAVDCALDEVSRRVELGLSCSCLPLEVHDKIGTQVVSNAGIREESSRRNGGENLSGADSFSPGELMQFLESLAGAPHSKTDRLHFVTKKAQLLGYNRWRGRYELPVLEVGGGLLEDDTQFAAEGDGSDFLGSEGANEVPSRKRKLNDRDGSFRKQKYLPVEERLQTKEKSMSVLMTSSLQDGDRRTVRRAGRKSTSSGKKRESVTFVPSDSKVKRQKNMLSGTSNDAENFEGVDLVSTKNLTPDEILAKLSMAARNPMQGHDILNPVVGLLRKFRNSFLMEKLSAQNEEKHAGVNNGEQSSNIETTDKFGFEGIEDSYWTDRIIQRHTQDHVSKEAASELEASVNKDGDAAIMDLDTENPLVRGNELSKDYSPTAMILEFTNSESIPSVSNLNEIFSRYGPLNESDTKVASKSKRARVVFKRRADAETAFSSPGKFSIFGPSLFRYHLDYAPSLRKARETSKGNKKTPVKVKDV